jgi:hypothetical protein
MVTITFDVSNPAYLAKNGTPLHPACHKCGWRMGGVDSWNGSTCKCGAQSRTFVEMARTWNASAPAVLQTSDTPLHLT